MRLKHLDIAYGSDMDASQEFPTTKCVTSSSASLLADASASSQQVLHPESSNSVLQTMSSEISLNTSLLSESFSSFPTTPNAEDFFKNLPKSTTPGLSDIDIEPSPSPGTCIANSNGGTLLPQSSFIYTNPSISYSHITQAPTKTSTESSCLISSDFQNSHVESLFLPSNSVNQQMCGLSVLEEPLDVRYGTESCLPSSDLPYIDMVSAGEENVFTIQVGNNCKVFSEMPTDSPTVSGTSSFQVSNSSDHQLEPSMSIQKQVSFCDSFQENDQQLLQREIPETKRTESDKYPNDIPTDNPNVEEDGEMGVLPPDLCLFEVVSMLKCSRCDDVFPDTASLIQHYQKLHVAGYAASPVKIKVDTAANVKLQKNKPVVVCHKCGSKVPSSVLEWYVSKVRGKTPGRKKKTLPSSETTQVSPSAPSDLCSPIRAENINVPSDMQACLDSVASGAPHSWSASLSPPAYDSHESFDNASQSMFVPSDASREEPASPSGEPSNSSPAAARESQCSDENSELSEEESVAGDGNKKGGSEDSTMQVYVLDVLGGTAQHKGGQDAGGDRDVQQKRLVRPPAKLTEDEPPPIALQTPPKIHKCGTEGCRLRFSSTELRDLHRRCHRPPPLHFMCPFCSFTMKKWYAVQRHLWQVHQRDVDMLRCSACTTFRAHNEHSLRVHQETHSAVKAYPCQTCGQRFRQLSQLLNHSKTHRSEKERHQPEIQCSECGKPCCNERQLSRHIKAVHEKVCLHRCSLCPYATNRPADLRSHKRRHAKDKSFECCVCEMRFCDKTSQRRHLLRHLPLSLLQCPLCSFHTSSPQHFSSHFSSVHPPLQQQQQQALTFECKLCGEKCSTASLYCSHSRTHHSDLLQQLVAQHPPASKPS